MPKGRAPLFHESFAGLAGFRGLLLCGVLLIGESIWLFWLFLLGFRLLRQKEAVETDDDWFFESRLATQHVVKFIQQHLRA